MQKEARDAGGERGSYEGKGRDKEKGDDWNLSEMRNKNVQDFGESLTPDIDISKYQFFFKAEKSRL